MRHVRSHVGWPGNELADWLADAGRECVEDDPSGECVAAAEPLLQEAAAWMTRWQDGQAGRARDGRAAGVAHQGLPTTHPHDPLSPLPAPHRTE